MTQQRKGAPRFRITIGGTTRLAGAAAAAKALKANARAEVCVEDDAGYDGSAEQVVADYLADQRRATDDYNARLKAADAIRILENDARRTSVKEPP